MYVPICTRKTILHAAPRPIHVSTVELPVKVQTSIAACKFSIFSGTKQPPSRTYIVCAFTSSLFWRSEASYFCVLALASLQLIIIIAYKRHCFVWLDTELQLYRQGVFSHVTTTAFESFSSIFLSCIACIALPTAKMTFNCKKAFQNETFEHGGEDGDRRTGRLIDCALSKINLCRELECDCDTLPLAAQVFDSRQYYYALCTYM